MPGLTTKVFRTFRASSLLQAELDKTPISINSFLLRHLWFQGGSGGGGVSCVTLHEGKSKCNVVKRRWNHWSKACSPRSVPLVVRSRRGKGGGKGLPLQRGQPKGGRVLQPSSKPDWCSLAVRANNKQYGSSLEDGPSFID